jgi:predicted Zn-dependent protease
MTVLKTIVLAIVALMLSTCATNPVTGKKELILLSEDQEVSMGQEYDPQITASMGLYDDQKLQDFIDRKGQEMANISHRSDIQYHFKILDQPVVNAFAVPGGYIYFTRGIMAHFNNEAEFAGVLGHEIGHVAARHSAKQYTNQVLAQIGIVAGVIIQPELAQFADIAQTGIGLLFLKFSRENESQSDELGVEYSTKIGYDAHQMADFFNTIGRLQEESGADQIPNFLSTHPDPAGREDRVHQLASDWQAKDPQSSYDVNRDTYLQLIDGIVYGEDPRQGFVESGFFYHPDLKFQFPIPSGWITTNSPIQVQIAPSNGKALLVFTLAQENTLQQAASAAAERNNFEIQNQQNIKVHGFPAIRLMSLVRNQQDPSSDLQVLSYFIEDGQYIYLFHGLSLQKDFKSFQSALERSMTGYQRLTDQNKLNRKPDRLHIKQAPHTATLSELLAGFGINSSEALEEHAIVNGIQLSDRVEAGTKIKVIGK